MSGTNQTEEVAVTTTTFDQISSAVNNSTDVYEYFDDSCYQFMFADELRDDNATCIRDISIFDRMIGLFIIALQIALYIYLSVQTAGDVMADKIPAQIKFSLCVDVNNNTINIADNLTCEPGSENILPALAAIVVLAFFIIPDVASATKLFKCKGFKPKITGVLIIIEGISAMVAGAMFANVGNLTSGVDSFLGCVGVVFIHDIDEKIRDFYKVYAHGGYVLLFVVPLVIAAGAIIILMNSIR